MEGMQQEQEVGVSERQETNGWDRWDAVPRDGPAVFALDLHALEAEGRMNGRWINPTLSSEVVTAQLKELIGGSPLEGTWAVVDQVGLGPRMMPETLDITELATAAEDTWRDGVQWEQVAGRVVHSTTVAALATQDERLHNGR